MKPMPFLAISGVLVFAAFAMRPDLRGGPVASSHKKQSSLRSAVVDLKSADGILLKATYFSAGKPGPGVLLFHQSNRTRTSWDEVASQLAAAGINTLTVDSRGHGESGGNEEARKKYWSGDLDAAFQFLIGQRDVKRDVTGFGGAGVLGVEDAVETARRHPAEVKSLVLLSGETVQEGLQFLKQSWQLPGLFVTDDRDEYPPTMEAMELLYITSSSASKKLVHYSAAHEAPWLWYEPFDIGKVPPNDSHGTDMFKTHPELPGIIIDWFVTTLIKTPGHAPADTVACAAILNLVRMPGGPQQVTRQLMEARSLDPKAQLWPEITMSIIGQDHIRAGEPKEAVEVLKLNLLAYPDSADANETLAEAYLGDGEKDEARQLAQKALSLLDSPDLPASSWTNTDQYRGEIRHGAQQVLDKLKSQ